jgi:hypothetical protein
VPGVDAVTPGADLTNTPMKIMIKGKEVELPQDMDISKLPPELKELLADKDGNGVPDIADNPFAMLGKLGQLASLAKDAPVLLSSFKTKVEKKGLTEDASASPISSPSLPLKPALSAPPKRTMEDYRSYSPPIKKDNGRRALFILVVIGLIGWYLWQSGLLPNLDF